MDYTHVVVIGDGPDRPRLERIACELGIADRVFFTGLVRDPADYVVALDAFVLPSDALESFGNAVVEAMALGVPSTVMADSPGVCEHIVDGETGFVAADVEQLASILGSLAGDPDRRSSVGARGAKSVRVRYTIEGIPSAPHSTVNRSSLPYLVRQAGT